MQYLWPTQSVRWFVFQAVKLTSSRTQLPYEYYSLPFCKPESVFYKGENLGKWTAVDMCGNWSGTFLPHFSPHLIGSISMLSWNAAVKQIQGFNIYILHFLFLFSPGRWGVTWGPYCEQSLQCWDEQRQEMWDDVQQENPQRKREQADCWANPGGVLRSPVSMSSLLLLLKVFVNANLNILLCRIPCITPIHYL